MIDLDNHIASASPNYNVYTYNFTKKEVEELKEALQHNDLRKEIKLLLEETK